MATIEEMIKDSMCFGIAYDGKCRECKICEVSMKCEAKCRSGIGDVPEKPSKVVLADIDEVSETEVAAKKTATKEKAAPKTTTKAKPAGKKSTSTSTKAEKKYDPEMPNFTPMSMDELIAMLPERGLNVADFDKYSEDRIRRMRIVQKLKATYEIK